VQVGLCKWGCAQVGLRAAANPTVKMFLCSRSSRICARTAQHSVLQRRHTSQWSTPCCNGGPRCNAAQRVSAHRSPQICAETMCRAQRHARGTTSGGVTPFGAPRARYVVAHTHAPSNAHATRTRNTQHAHKHTHARARTHTHRQYCLELAVERRRDLDRVEPVANHLHVTARRLRRRPHD
jgi:hypothetical protein